MRKLTKKFKKRRAQFLPTLRFALKMGAPCAIKMKQLAKISKMTKKSKSDKKTQKGIRASIKNTFSELKKVEWCSIKNVFKYTFISIIIATIMALALYSLNCASAEIVDLVKGTL